MSRKNVRISLTLLLVLAIFVSFFYWWLRLHIRDLIEEMVALESRGKVSVKIGSMYFRPFNPPRIDLINTRLIILDQTGKQKLYTVSFRYLGLELYSLKSLLIDRKLQVDFIVAENPEIEIDRENRQKKGNESVPFEIGNIYHAINNISKQLQIKRFRIFNGSLELKNLPPYRKTVKIAGVDFNLEDFSFTNPDGSARAGNIKAREIDLHTGRQDIVFPEGNFRIQYASLDITTKDSTITIDSCTLEGKGSDTAYRELKASFARLKLVRPDLRALYENGQIKVDSIYCTEPSLLMKIDVTKKPGKRTEDRSIEKNIAGLLGFLDIRYIGLLNSNIGILTKNGNRYVPFSSRGNNFEVHGIRVDSTREIPIEIEQLVFAIKNYKAYSSDSLYDVRFDSVVYNKSHLSLKNFILEPTGKNRHPDKKYISVPEFELRNISLSELVTNKRLRAQELVLKNSRTINYYIPKSDRLRPTQPVKSIIRDVNNKIDLGKVSFVNGYLLSQSVAAKEQKLEVIGFNSVIAANELLEAPSYELMGFAIGMLSFEQLRIQSGSKYYQLDQGEMQGKEKLIRASHAKWTNDEPRSSLEAYNIRIRNYQFDNELSLITVDSISWNNASFSIQKGGPKQTPATSAPGRQTDVVIGNLSARNTLLNYSVGDSVRISTELSSLDIKEISTAGEKDLDIEGLSLAGSQLDLQVPGLSLKAGSYLIRDHASSKFSNVNLDLHKAGDTIRALVPDITFVPMLQETIEAKYPILQQLILNQPVIYVSLTTPTKQNAQPKSKSFQFELGQFQFKEGQVRFLMKNGEKTNRFQTGFLDGTVNKINVGIGSQSISTSSFSLTTSEYELSLKDSIRLYSNAGRLRVKGDMFGLGQGNDIDRLKARVSLVRIDSLGISIQSKKGGNPFVLENVSLGGNDFVLDSSDRRHIVRQIKNNPSLYIKGISLGKQDDKIQLFAYGIGFENAGKVVTVDSFRFRPSMDRDSFNRMQAYQKDYLTLKTGKITFRNVDIERLLADSTLTVSHINVQDPVLTVYKDKRLPFEHGIIKPLPTKLLKRIGLPMHIDTVRLRNALIQYEEFNDKTLKTGLVLFTETEAELTNIMNHDFGSNDSLKLRAITRFLDTAVVRMGFWESYTDTLSGFLWLVRISPFSLPALNTILDPLASANVSAGYLDTLNLRVIGREYVAHGKMKMYYRDLKVKILDKSNPARKTLVTRMANFAASLMVNKKNIKKTGSVYTERVRERSIFNYWIKIMLSGAMTNAGIRKNSKMEKKYKKKVKKLKVPEIPEVEL